MTTTIADHARSLRAREIDAEARAALAEVDAIGDWQVALRRLRDLGLVVTCGASHGDTVAILVEATPAGREALRRIAEFRSDP